MICQLFCSMYSPAKYQYRMFLPWLHADCIFPRVYWYCLSWLLITYSYDVLFGARWTNNQIRTRHITWQTFALPWKPKVTRFVCLLYQVASYPSHINIMHIICQLGIDTCGWLLNTMKTLHTYIVNCYRKASPATYTYVTHITSQIHIWYYNNNIYSHFI